MNRPAINSRSLDQDFTCAALLRMAQRELAALFRAVTESFGPEQAELSAEDWLHEVGARATLPASAREWQQITVRVIAQLAQRGSSPDLIAASAQIQPAGC